MPTITVPVPLGDQTEENASIDINNQRTVNLIPIRSTNQGRGTTNLEKQMKFSFWSTPGLLEKVDLSGSKVREIMRVNDTTAYAVMDNKVYKLTVDQELETVSSSLVGTIGTFEGRIAFDKNPTQLMFSDYDDPVTINRAGYIITLATDTLTTISDADYPGGKTIRYIDSYFVTNPIDAGTLYSCDENDGTSWNALNFATAEAFSDNTVAIARNNGQLWVFGTDSTEIMNNDGGSGFPFVPVEGATIEQGCGAAYSIQNINNSLIWLDDRGFIVQNVGYDAKIISNETINKEIPTYRVKSDAFSYQYLDRGHLFYAITFPTAQKTWVYDLNTGLWHEQAYWTENATFTRSKINCVARMGKLTLAGDFESGKIYAIKSNVYLDGTQEIHRIKTTPFLYRGFDNIEISRLELKVQAGHANSTGVGSDPKIMLRISKDGGHTWGNEIVRSIGKIGEYNKRVKFPRLGTAREWLFEFRFSDPCAFSLIEAVADVSGGYKA